MTDALQKSYTDHLMRLFVGGPGSTGVKECGDTNNKADSRTDLDLR